MMLPTDFQFQPVDPRNVAEYLCTCISQGPAGRLPNFGGPEVHTLGDMARTWQKILGKKKPIIRVPLPGKTAKTLRQGGLTCPDEKHGTTTWEEWLRQTSTRSKAKTTDTSVSKHEVTFDEAH
jgi:uncharacterized protein YbjT (DUF2867 family)